MVAHLASGGSPRAVWGALPGADWPLALAHAAAATLASGRGSVLCAPDRKDVDRLDAALTAVLGEGQHVVLTADLGPAERYRSFLAVSRGAVKVVVGTRAAAFAPVHDLGLVALWDDGDDLYAEPRAPYPHTREVLLLRAADQGCARVVGGVARTVESAYLVRTGWAREVVADRATLRVDRTAGRGHRRHRRRAGPRPDGPRHPAAAYGVRRDPGGARARPGAAADAAAGLRRQPGLRPLPHARALPRLLRPAGPDRTAHPAPVPLVRRRRGGVGLRGLRRPRPAGAGARRAPHRRGGRPGVPAGAGAHLRRRPGARRRSTTGPAIVVATPGAEPVAEGGYACVVLLDTWLMLARADLRTAEESLRRWLNAAALARSARRPAAGWSRSATPAEPGPAGAGPLGPRRLRAARDDRAALRAPAAGVPAGHRSSGPEEDVEAAVAALRLPAGAEVLGPVPEPRDGRRGPLPVRPGAAGRGHRRCRGRWWRCRASRRAEARAGAGAGRPRGSRVTGVSH